MFSRASAAPLRESSARDVVALAAQVLESAPEGVRVAGPTQVQEKVEFRQESVLRLHDLKLAALDPEARLVKVGPLTEGRLDVRADTVELTLRRRGDVAENYLSLPEAVPGRVDESKESDPRRRKRTARADERLQA